VRRLFFLRHARAGWGTAETQDFDRPLEPDGEAGAVRIGAYMQGHGLCPGQVLCSPARRARETWRHVAAALVDAPPACYRDALYEATPEALIALIRALPDDALSVMIVGHNPSLASCASRLARPIADEARRSRLRGFPTAALAVIAFDTDGWAKAGDRTGQLELLVDPDTIGT
jgi:phosphohistidine phosphatase